jgi:hypothetical protein
MGDKPEVSLRRWGGLELHFVRQRRRKWSGPGSCSVWSRTGEKAAEGIPQSDAATRFTLCKSAQSSGTGTMKPLGASLGITTSDHDLCIHIAQSLLDGLAIEVYPAHCVAASIGRPLLGARLPFAMRASYHRAPV